ncbi:flagellar filament capping protein FliD [Ferrimonas marina]|uniref:Flagellar hook-associated protein 2 n=1 Tax=Ferrimonas marina TaxID=299255 RepID=A0A1M5YFC1_9GAMM|nr:flagellar filament capping protein FliD [Ferrimonas marina]SHI10548.1 flagellar hook-associated protein 2 [Ferrimonas marina]
MGLTAAGIGSGLDINGIVEATLAASYTPRFATLDVRAAKAETEISALGTLKSSLGTFQSAVEDLQDPATFDKRRVSTSTEDYLSASVDSEAVPGTYNVEVLQLAESQKLRTNDLDPDLPLTGTLTIGQGVDEDGNPLPDPEQTFSIEVDEEDGLEEIAAKINAADDNPGVSATVVQTESGPRLVIGSDETGLENQITVTANGAPGSQLDAVFGNMVETQAAQDARISVDGMIAVSASNRVDSVVPGLTLNLTKAEPGEITRVSVTRDEAAAKASVEAFVEAFKELSFSISYLTTVNEDSEDPNAGALQSDSMTRSITSQLRNAIGDSYPVNGELKTLSQFGISFTREGVLEIDDEMLTEAIENDMAGLAELFAAEDVGLAYKLHDVTDNYLQTGGMFDTRDESLQRQLTQIDKEREALERQMAATEARLYKQYNAMDLAVAQLSQQGAYVTSSLNNLPGLIRSSD